MKKSFHKLKQYFQAHPVLQKVLYVLLFSAWVFGIFDIITILLSLICTLIAPVSFWTSTVGNTLFAAISYIVALAVIIFVPWKISKKLRTTREEVGLKGFPTWTDIGLAPIGYVVATLLGLVFVALFSLFPWFDAEEAQDVGYSFLNGGFDRILAFLALVIIAPIAEEIIYRGWFYGKLRKKLNFPIAAIIVSLIFGLAHGQWNVGVNVFAMSLVLCSLREITGTIYAGIILHMIKNGVAFYLLYILGIS